VVRSWGKEGRGTPRKGVLVGRKRGRENVEREMRSGDEEEIGGKRGIYIIPPLCCTLGTNTGSDSWKSGKKARKVVH